MFSSWINFTSTSSIFELEASSNFLDPISVLSKLPDDAEINCSVLLNKREFFSSILGNNGCCFCDVAATNGFSVFDAPFWVTVVATPKPLNPPNPENGFACEVLED